MSLRGSTSPGAPRTADTLVRFLLASVVNNLATVGLFQALLFVMSAQASYVIAWCVGLLLVVAFYPQHVFGVRAPTKRDKLVIACIYLSSFVVGLLIVRAMSGDAALARLSIFVVLLSNFVINFGITKAVLGRGRR